MSDVLEQPVEGEPTDTPPPPAEPPQEETPPQPVQITTADQWRRRARARYMVKLPSGAVVKARRADGAELITEGLLSLDEFNQAQTGAQDGATIKARVDAARRCCTRIVVEPAVAMPNGSAPAGEIMSAEDIPAVDAILLFTWSIGLTQQVGLEVTEITE